MFTNDKIILDETKQMQKALLLLFIVKAESFLQLSHA